MCARLGVICFLLGRRLQRDLVGILNDCRNGLPSVPSWALTLVSVTCRCSTVVSFSLSGTGIAGGRAVKESQSWQALRNVWVGELSNSSDSCSPVLQRRWSQSFFPLGGGRQGADRLGSMFKRNDSEFSHLSLNIFSAPGCVGGKGSYSGSIMTFHYVAALWISVCLTSAAHCLLMELIPTSPFCYLSIEAAEIACEETIWICLSDLGECTFKFLLNVQKDFSD